MGSKSKQSLIIGAIFGFAAGYIVNDYVNRKYILPKYKQEADKVVKDFVDKNFGKVMNEPVDPKKEEVKEEPVKTMKDYSVKMKTLNYIPDEPVEEIKETKSVNSFPISKNKYDSSELDQITLTMYSDGIVANDEFESVPLELFPDDLEYMFDEDTDVVYIRNETTNADYEITKDPRTYSEVMRAVRY